MFLKSLRVYSGRLVKLTNEVPFRWTTHHVTEIFISLLPKNYELDGSSLVQITCGLDEGQPTYRQMLGSSEYYIPDFDFQGYYNLSLEEREKYILGVIEKTLTEIARQYNANELIIFQTAEEVRRREFNLKIHIKKLSKKFPGRALKIDVYRHLSKEGGEDWTLEVIQSKEVVHKEFMRQRPNSLDLRDYFKKSEWNGHDFIVFSKPNKEVYRFNVSAFLD
jgi:hypothetical protein